MRERTMVIFSPTTQTLEYAVFFRELGMDQELEGLTDSRRYQVTEEALKKHHAVFGNELLTSFLKINRFSELQFAVLEGEDIARRAWDVVEGFGMSGFSIVFVPETSADAERAINIWLPELRRPIRLVR